MLELTKKLIVGDRTNYHDHLGMYKTVYIVKEVLPGDRVIMHFEHDKGQMYTIGGGRSYAMSDFVLIERREVLN